MTFLPDRFRFPSLLLAFAVLIAGSTRADACFVHATQPVWVWLDEVQVDLDGVVARKTYNCVFKNPNASAVVGGTCYMEIEPGAQIDGLVVEVDGKEYRAEVLSKDEAGKVFQKIVKEGGSPALLEYYGNQLVQTQLPKIAPGGTVTVKLRYTQILKPKAGLIRLQTLNTNPKAEKKALQSAAVKVRIKNTEPIKTVYSPTHELNYEEEEGWDVVVNWSEKDYLPKHPFVIYVQTDPRPFSASLMAHREFDEDGTFLLMLSPGTDPKQVDPSQILPKDIVFCVDTSGSMLQKDRMAQAKKALDYCIANLRPQDRFAIVDFGTRVNNWPAEGTAEVNAENRKAAREYVDGLYARGGTRMEPALKSSLDHFGEGDRLKLVVFFTDGKPTLGERDPQKILKSIDSANTDDVRLFVFGGGYDVNARLLDVLAMQHRGEADYILPGEDLTTKISGFFDRVGSPMLRDLKVTADGLELIDVYPREIPDLYAGEPVLILGRYRGHGPKTVTLTGTANGSEKTFEYDLEFPEYSDSDAEAFVTRLWAGAKIDTLIADLRASGSETPDQKTVDEITTLARKYGIVTPWTSYLVRQNVQGEGNPGVPGGIRPIPRPLVQNRAGGGVGGGNAAFGRRLKAESTIETAPASDAAAVAGQEQLVRDSKKAAEFRKRSLQKGYASGFDEAVAEEFEFAEEPADGSPEEKAKRKIARESAQLSTLRYVGNRAFYRGQNEWVQGDFTPKTEKIKEIEVDSDEAMKLISEDPRLAKYFALGDVVLSHRGQWYRVQQRKKG